MDALLQPLKLKPQYAKGKIYQSGVVMPYVTLNARMFIDPQCYICGTNDVDVLDVHHIDRNKANQELENLVILCANHHRKVHRHPQLLEQRRQTNNLSPRARLIRSYLSLAESEQ